MIFPPVHETLDKGHGRVEIRRIQTSSELNDYLDFPHVGQVFRLTRDFTEVKTGENFKETVYGVTSLAGDRAGAEGVLSYNRAHWSIENRSHYVRDWTFDEDRSQVRTGKGPQMMACLRNLAVGLLRLAGEKNIARAVREVAARPHLALQLLGL